MTSDADNITVQIKYKDVEQTFIGKPEDVWLCVNRFFNEFIPSFEIVKKIMLTVDLQQLVKDCDGVIAFSQEGANLLVARNKLTDNETLATYLLANYVGHQLGVLKDDAVSKDELQVKLSKDAKIASTRLGELVKNGMATRTDDEKYRITTFGIVHMQKDILPKIRTKLGA